MRSKRKTVKDLYLLYPHKCRDVTSNTVADPYFPKAEIDCEHSKALTYKEYKNLIMCFVKYYIILLAQGDRLKLPLFMGYFQLKKIKGGGFDYNTYNKTGEKTKFKNRKYKGHRFLLKWVRKKSKMRYSWMWKIRLTKHAWKTINDKFSSNFSLINNLINA